MVLVSFYNDVYVAVRRRPSKYSCIKQLYIYIYIYINEWLPELLVFRKLNKKWSNCDSKLPVLGLLISQANDQSTNCVYSGQQVPGTGNTASYSSQHFQIFSQTLNHDYMPVHHNYIQQPRQKNKKHQKKNEVHHCKPYAAYCSFSSFLGSKPLKKSKSQLKSCIIGGSLANTKCFSLLCHHWCIEPFIVQSIPDSWWYCSDCHTLCWCSYQLSEVAAHDSMDNPNVGVFHMVSQEMLHSLYNSLTFRDDIMLVKLSSSIVDIQHVQLEKAIVALTAGQTLTFMGFGAKSQQF